MYHRILVAVDSSHASDRALAEAIENARAPGARLLIVHVLEDVPGAIAANPYADDYVRGLREHMKRAGATLLERARARAAAAGVQAETLFHDEGALPVPARIVQSALDWEADLIVMGTHGHHGVKRAMLGSSAEGVVRSAPVPILLVRTP
ncbi:universal stress protein [Achromobacter spanius]|uniref:universal stress protein n=1 Tax=Achromobacter spanius TaxID=217203 RepID=UPI0032093A21